jgi:hypothetical protein
VQEATKEFAGRKTKPVLEKGSWDYDVFGVGSGDIFPPLSVSIGAWRDWREDVFPLV